MSLLKQISIENIVCDIIGRTNNDVSDLLESILTFGQLEPIIVEGPDENERYYLIHGYRRYLAFHEAKEKFSKVLCLVLRKPTSPEERHSTRMIIFSNNKKSTGLDQQLVYEELTPDQRKKVVPPKKQKRMKKGINIPQKIRIKYEKKHRSQDALNIIYNLDCPVNYKQYLMNELYEGNINTIHGDAIKRVINHELYERLNDNQKTTVISKALEVAKFTNNDAGMLIFKELMKQNPQEANMGSWVEHVKDEMEKVSELLTKKMAPLISEKEKESLRNTVEEVNGKLFSDMKKNINNKSNIEKINKHYNDWTKNPELTQKLLTLKNRKGITINFIYQ